METHREIDPSALSRGDSEKDCPRCTQPLGSNPDCDNCAAAAHWSKEERQSLINQRRTQDRRYRLTHK